MKYLILFLFLVGCSFEIKMDPKPKEKEAKKVFVCDIHGVEVSMPFCGTEEKCKIKCNQENQIEECVKKITGKYRLF